VGSRLPRRYNEASFTFATCTALAVRYSGGDLESGEDLESGHTLFFTRTPKPERGSWQPPDCPHCPRAKGEKREVCHNVDTGGRETSKGLAQGSKH
jgi:hypothetical protein